MRYKVRVLIFCVGFLIGSFPFFANLFGRQYQKDAVATYTKKAAQIEEEEKEDYLQKAVEYNAVLYQSCEFVIEDGRESILSDDSYESILRVSESGIMGKLEIPKIDVYMPIYHGTSEEVLAVGAGHLQGSSFPVGGRNTRAVLTGHRGSPNAKLFTRLDELELDDLFFIQVLDQTMAYRVVDIDVILPEDVETLDIVEEKDLVTLLTCTPYGINSHRLVITGERTEYTEEIYELQETGTMSARESFFTFAPFIFLTMGIFSLIISIRWKKRQR